MPRLRNDRLTRERARGDTLVSMVPPSTLVNDVHSGLNATNVRGIHQPISIDALREVWTFPLSVNQIAHRTTHIAVWSSC